jgi:hypothetical protein
VFVLEIGTVANSGDSSLPTIQTCSLTKAGTKQLAAIPTFPEETVVIDLRVTEPYITRASYQVIQSLRQGFPAYESHYSNMIPGALMFAPSPSWTL